MADQREWTILEALQWCTRYLQEHSDPNPRLSAQWLLAHVTGLSRVEVYAYHDRLLSERQRISLREKLARRAVGEPLQYLIGEAAFRGLTLQVTPSVLIPRPETEGLAQLVIEHLGVRDKEERSSLSTVLDLGTGSGALALALACECPHARLIASDISSTALGVARQNAEHLGLDQKITFIQSDCFAAFAKDTFDVIVSNPPYIPSKELDSLEVQVRDFEPIDALDGGADGLDVFRQILAGTIDHLAENGALFVELDERNVTQGACLAVQLKRYSDVAVRPDLSGRDRYLVATGFRD